MIHPERNNIWSSGPSIRRESGDRPVRRLGDPQVVRSLADPSSARRSRRVRPLPDPRGLETSPRIERKPSRISAEHDDYYYYFFSGLGRITKIDIVDGVRGFFFFGTNSNRIFVRKNCTGNDMRAVRSCFRDPRGIMQFFLLLGVAKHETQLGN